MATTPPFPDDLSVTVVAPDFDIQNDPFRSVGPTHTRFSQFNAKLFSLGPNASPAQAKRALEAHIAETDRRMEEAGKLGTALVQQRNELSERLKEVEKLQAEEGLPEELRQKLVDIERDYHEVARESVRASIARSRVPSNEGGAGSPFISEGKGGKRSVSPAKFEAQATGSPTKSGVTNRKIRNQSSNRIHDIEFAAEISTSLIAQVRNLQGLLGEKEEELKDTRAENSKLEYEVEGFRQRLKTLDDSEQRYKDENWNLETQIHELMAKEREAADREKKLTQTLNIIQAERNAGQRELDEIKLNHSKLVEEHAAAVKHHDIELGTAKRTMVMGESERAAMQKKIDELTGRNTELAKAMSLSIRGGKQERESIIRTSDEDFQTAYDNSTPEQSPPPSPIKSTPRHSMLESETIRTSLAHAQRTIQSLRTNVHREKTEKMETRRLLQEARDEIEKMRSEPVIPPRRARKAESKEFRKPPRLLGGLRSARSEIFLDDPDWEDQPDILPHPRSSPMTRETTALFAPVPEHTDHFETANETSDAAFETAHENATETDDFHTGAEEFSSDDAETETESPSKRRTLTGRPPNPFTIQRSASIDSSASTEDEDFPYDDIRTPPSLPPPSKFPLRVARGAYRRSRNASEEPAILSSPPSFVSSSNVSTPQQRAQNLAAELGDFDASDDESTMSATPSKRSIRGRTITPPPPLPRFPRAIMVDSGMMTEPLDEFSLSFGGAGADRPVSMNTAVSRFSLGSDYSDTGAHGFGDKLAEFPVPPTSSQLRDLTFAPELVLSTVHSHGVEPFPEADLHESDMTALRKEHAEQVKNLATENASALAATIALLKSKHADELAAAKHASAQELENLQSVHEEATDKAMADIKMAHNHEIEAIKAEHADAIREAIADAQHSHVQELESLRTFHAQQVAQKESESTAAHAAEMEALKGTHAEELSRKQSETAAGHVAELEALKLLHVEEFHRKESDIKTAHDAEIERLKVAHAESLSQKESELKVVASAELEALVAKHAEDLANLKTDNEATHAAELTALLESQASKLDATQKALHESHAKELDDLESSHAVQIEQAKQSIGAEHSAQLESIKALHLQQIDDVKASINGTHAAELELLQSAHAQQLLDTKNEITTAHEAAVASLTASHNKQLDDTKSNLQAVHAEELESLKSIHAQELEKLSKEKDATHTAAIAALVDSHTKEIDEIKGSMSAAHAQELERLKTSHLMELKELEKDKETYHATVLAAAAGAHTKQLETQKAEGDAAMSREIAALKVTHAQEIETLNSQHAAAHAKELESFKAAIAKQIESSRTEGDVARSQQIDALKAAHDEIIQAHKRDAEVARNQALESLKSLHDRQIDALNGEHTTARSKELEDLANQHMHERGTLESEHEASMSRLREELDVNHSKQIEALRQEIDAAHLNHIESLVTQHAKDLEASKDEHQAAMSQRIRELEEYHSQKVVELHREGEQVKAEEIAALVASHTQALDTLRTDHASELAGKVQEISKSHVHELDTLRQQNEDDWSRELAALNTKHQSSLEELKNELELTHQQDLAQLKSAHATALESLRAEHQTVLDQSLSNLRTEHSEALETVRSDRDASQSEALGNLEAQHLERLEHLKTEADAARARELDMLKAEHAQALESKVRESEAMLSQELDALKSQHAQILESQTRDSTLEKENLLTAHAAELEALRASFVMVRPALAYSSISSVQTEPVESSGIKSPRREAFIIPQDRELATPRAAKKQSKTVDIPIIAEDDTRQSPSAIIVSEAPDSQQPFKEITSNTDGRSLRNHAANITHQGAQTTLTAEGLDRLIKTQRLQSQDSATMTTHQGAETGPRDQGSTATPSTIRRRLSTDSLGSMARTKHRTAESGIVVAPEPIPARRPGSSASVRSTQARPPLPSNHREAIEAARTNSAQGGKGTMGPPLLPVSAYRPSSAGAPPSGSKPPVSPASVLRGAPVPRSGRTPGYADIYSPARMPIRSRQSSISSFASEIDTRFNIHNGMAMDPAGFGPSTDPRMIQAVTQTMIGEYLWKYTRKTGRGEMSENRHRRFFWVHPYTRALYWSDGDPGAAIRGEMRAKSVPIEAVRVVADDNPMPPGLHRKSLVVIAPGRTVKFTCTTGQRHETWFNALSYLLLRSGNENKQDAEEMAGNITQDDVEEFNPTAQRQSTSGQRPRPPPSLSSYNSRTTRNESPSLEMTMSIPTLTPTHEKEATRNGTFGRLSGYWKSSSIGRNTLNSLRSRSYQPYDSAIYEASEVPDSAEDLRQIIEQQDRESDRLENVRACCDGKHDVSTLPYTSKRGRLPNFQTQSHTHTHTHPGPPGSQSLGSIRSRS